MVIPKSRRDVLRIIIGASGAAALAPLSTGCTTDLFEYLTVTGGKIHPDLEGKVEENKLPHYKPRLIDVLIGYSRPVTEEDKLMINNLGGEVVKVLAYTNEKILNAGLPFEKIVEYINKNKKVRYIEPNYHLQLRKQ